jgi:sensor histidine kinase YesM
MALIGRYSYTITERLARLSIAAEAVGRGEYDHPLPPYVNDDEIRTLHDAFGNMQESAETAFVELTRKAELERSLMEERMRVLTYQHRLKDAELLALQTQINPHFLYNTLSAGWQLALTEGNEKTAEFIEKLAAFIRYALKPSTRFVLISEEIECVRQYIWLQKMRFGERYRFRLEVQDETLGFETPALVLQPLVENAITHGLRDFEKGGEVAISARIEGDTIRLSVSDSGRGMKKEDIAVALAAADPEDATPQHGIGLHNVVRRVSLATGGVGIVEIESEIGHGTRVTVVLPKGKSQ